MELILIIGSPIVASIASFFSSKRKDCETATIVAGAVALAAALFAAQKVSSEGTYSPNDYFSIDALGAIIISLIAFIGFIAALYSTAYLRRETEKGIIGFEKVRLYFILFNLFIAAMLLAASTSNPIIMWIAIEGTTLSTAFLISFYNKPSAMEAAWKYLIINSIGLLLGFFGTLLFYTALTHGEGIAFNWDYLMDSAKNLDPMIAKIAFIFILVGYGTKTGLVPMHTWLPDAHSKAPAPVSGLLSGLLLNVAMLAILRFKVAADAAIGGQFTGNLLIWFGLISIVLAGFIIMVQKNYKRLLAYSSIENMGIAALGFGFGGIGAFAAILHIIYHALAKSLLFFSSGNIFLRYSSTKIAKVKGMLSVIPATSLVFIIGFLTIVGVPPFGIFMTKFYILSEGLKIHPVQTIIALAAFVIIFIGFLTHAAALLFGNAPEEISKEKENKWTIIPLAVLIIAFAVLSVYLPPPLKILIDSALTKYQ